MERQVPQVKRKNSTNCNCPDARLTVVGSVAWSSGPREVATGSGVGATASVGASVIPGMGCPCSRVGTGGGNVAVGGRAVGAAVSGAVAGAHAARKTASRLALSKIEGTRLGKRRVFIIIISI
jgi:hypothetical protein